MPPSTPLLNAAFIIDNFERNFNQEVRDAIRNNYDQFVNEILSSKLINQRFLPQSDEYSLRGFLMRGVIEPCLARLIIIDRKKLRSFSEHLIASINEHSSAKQINTSQVSYFLNGNDSFERAFEAITISRTTQDLVRRLNVQANIDLRNHIKTTYSDTVIIALNVIVKDSIRKTIEHLKISTVRLSEEINLSYMDNLEEDLRRSSSYLDSKGEIRFLISDQKLTFNQNTVTDRNIDYKKNLEKSISRVLNLGIIQRIDNQDRIIGVLFQEYRDELIEVNSGSIPISLSAIADLISQQIENNQSNAPKDERINGECVNVLSGFLAAHGLFIQSFSSMEEVIKDKDRSLDFYRNVNLDDRRVPWQVLQLISNDDSILEDKSRNAISKLYRAIPEDTDLQRQLLISLGISTLRGSLKTMAGIVMEESEQVKDKDKNPGIIPDLAKEGAKEAVKQFVKTVFDDKSEIFHASLNFFTVHSVHLMHLSSNIPGYFSWIGNFIKFIS